MRTILGVTLYNVIEIAEMLSVSKTTIHNYIKAGRLDAQKIGGKFFSTEESIRAFIVGSNNTKKEA